MPRRIDEDHKDFRDVYAGRLRKQLKKFISNGSIFRTRGDGRQINITIPKIDIPHIVFGDSGNGIGRGPGKPGDVIGVDKEKGKGNKAGDDEGEGITIAVDLEEILKFLQEELKLPNLKPKPSQVYEEIKIKYNDISKTGPEALRHNRRTMLQALKRLSASGDINKLHKITGYTDPVKLITPINSDRRYRQYKEIKIPASNAVIFFARDGSGSMDAFKCDIVSDMAWWIDIWIRQFYKRVERVYVWHDTVAQEVDQPKFYNYRYGGGTRCSSALKFISKQLEARYPPEKWNIYVFYFTDGENEHGDNETFIKTMKEQMPGKVVNFIGITQILSYGAGLKEFVDKSLPSMDNVKTTEIKAVPQIHDPNMYAPMVPIGDEEVSKQIKQAIIDLLGFGTNVPKTALEKEITT